MRQVFTELVPDRRGSDRRTQAGWQALRRSRRNRRLGRSIDWAQCYDARSRACRYLRLRLITEDDAAAGLRCELGQMASRTQIDRIHAQAGSRCRRSHRGRDLADRLPGRRSHDFARDRSSSMRRQTLAPEIVAATHPNRRAIRWGERDTPGPNPAALHASMARPRVANGCSKAMEAGSACAWAVARPGGVRICGWPAPRSKFTMSVHSRALCRGRPGGTAMSRALPAGLELL